MDELDNYELLQEVAEDDEEDEEKSEQQVETGEEDNGDEAGEDDVDGNDAGADTAEENADTAEEDEANDDDEDEDMEDKEEMDATAMLRLLQSMPEAEARRHEQFRRSHFDKNVVKRCMTQVIEEASVGERRVPSVHVTMSIVMSGLAKMFLGELIVEALEQWTTLYLLQ